MTADKKLTTSDSLKDWLLSVNPNLFTLHGNKTRDTEITVKFSFESVQLSDAADCTLTPDIRESALATLSKQERETLAILSARVKAEEKRLATLASQSRPRISRVSVKGMTACKA